MKNSALKKKDSERRKKIMDYGLIECSICRETYSIREYYKSERTISGRCFHCRRKMHTSDYNKHQSCAISPFVREKEKFLNSCGYRKCSKCEFTLPLTEFKNKASDRCRKCSGGKVSNSDIQKYLFSFSLKKCSCCGGIKDVHHFYKTKTGGTRTDCKDCSKNHLSTWKSNNPKEYQQMMRNAGGRRRARQRNLHHKPITSEEYEILRAQRIKIFGE